MSCAQCHIYVYTYRVDSTVIYNNMHNILILSYIYIYIYIVYMHIYRYIYTCISMCIIWIPV